jgi:outer membrane lipoprotein-sorting protein
MKRLIGLGFGAVVVAVALAAGHPNEANGQSAGLVSSVLNRLQRNHESLRSLRASITMEKYNAQLRDAEKYYGVVLYLPGKARNASVRIEWSKPAHEILAVSSGQYTLFRPRLGVAYRGSAKSSRNKAGSVLDLMDMSQDQLRRRFQPVQDVREETLWGGVSSVHLKLVPLGSSEGYKYAEVWIDSSGMPVQAKIVEKNDDATTVRLNNLERNAKISADEFIVKLDPNVKIIKG